MSSIEERLARDIAAVTGGVVMTETDLEIAREALDERIDHRQRNRRRLAAGVAAAVVLIGGSIAAYAASGGDEPKGVGPAGEGDQQATMSDVDKAFLTGDGLTVQGLAGVWRLDNGARAFRFTADRSVRFDDRGGLSSDSATTGTYEIDDANRRITITTTASSRAECVGTTTAYWASTPSPDHVRLVAIGSPGESSDCAPVPLGQQVLEGITHIGREFAGYVASAGTETGWVPIRPSTLGGLYFDAEGRVLELDVESIGRGTASGRYFVVDETNTGVDQGTWQAGNAELTLTSAGQPGGCGPGERLVLSDAEQPPRGENQGIRGTITQNPCGGDWASPAWVSVPSLLTH